MSSTPMLGAHPVTSAARGPSLLRAAVPDVGYRLLRGRGAILAAQEQLVRLARRTAQAGDVDNLQYFLSTPDSLRKTPHLMMLEDAGGELTAAILLYEYSTPLGNTRVYATADGSGRRDVLAAPGQRAQVAAFAARTLIELGAQIVHLAFSEVYEASDENRSGLTGITPLAEGRPGGAAEQAIATELRRGLGLQKDAEWTLRERDIPSYLPLFETFDATLARIGQKTRANLRYYRRRSEADLGCEFVPQARLSLEEFLAFNRRCSYAVSDELARFRFAAMQGMPNSVMRGMRDGHGQWLSLVETRRQNGFVEMDWQMNRADLPAYSLATVMRAYLIEHEIGLGSTRLYIEGGTPQPIGRSFVRQRIGELTVKRRSAYVGLLERAAAFVFPPKNYIGQTLQDPELHWRRW